MKRIKGKFYFESEKDLEKYLLSTGLLPAQKEKLYDEYKRDKRFLWLEKPEMQKEGGVSLKLTGDDDVDDMRYLGGGCTIDEESAYRAYKAKRESSDYDKKMRALQAERDKLGATSLGRAAFMMKHPELKAWEAKKAAKERMRREQENRHDGFTFIKPKERQFAQEEVEVMSDEDIIAMAKDAARG